jgi:hypothetical protein
MVAMRPSTSLVRSCATLVATSVFLLTGCGGGAVAPDKARGQAVAEAAGGRLSGADLDRWLLKSPVAPNKVVASGLVSAWMNTALLIDAVRRDVVLDDPATTDSVIAEDASRGMISQFLAARFARRPPATEMQVDSLFASDRVRVFQQIVINVKSGSDSTAIAKTYTTARVLVGKLQGGGDFTAAVKQFSEDTATRARNGYLPALTKADLPARLAPVWNLQPGGVSPPVAGGAGFHILRRATRDESRPALKAWLTPRLAQRADSLFVDSLARAHDIVIAADARLRLRATALEPVTLSEGGPLVIWKGGSLGPGAVRTATLMLLPAERAALSDASDTIATQYLTGLARRAILMPLVSKDPPPNAEARAALAPRYRQTLDSLRAAVKRMPAGLSAADAAARYVDSVLAQRAPFLPLPGALASVLRGRGKVTVNRPVLDGVVRGAGPRWQEAHKNDSTTKGGAPDPAARPNGTPPPAN